MRLLDRYLLRELLVPLGYCLGGFLVFWVSFDLLGQLDDFQSSRLKPLEIAEYYLVKTPELLSVVLPVALLLALLYALSNHARHHELIAIRGAGVSLWRLSAPYLGVGLGLSLALFALNEVVLPDSNDRAEAILDRHKTGRSNPGASQSVQNVHILNARDNRTWSITNFNLVTGELRGVTVDWQLPDRSSRVIIAERAFWTPGAWQFQNAQILFHSGRSSLDVQQSRTNLLTVPEFTETPNEIKSEIKINSLSSLNAAKRVRLSLREIWDYRRLHPALRADRKAVLDTQYHGRLAGPWTCFVVVLIALPFGAASGRRNVFVGVASSILICFIYFILLKFGLALGTSGRLPGWVAAWLPNLAFVGAGIWLTLRVR
jgi:lipopolysaccharide export system permease protein